MERALVGHSPVVTARRVDYFAYLYIVLQGGLYWLFCQRVEDIGWDSSTYQGLARSLRETGTYYFNFAPHIQYPPGLPLILAGVGSVFGDGAFVYQRAIAVMAAASLWFVYEFLKVEQGRAVALTGTMLLGASIYYFEFATGVINSDIPWLLASIGALLVASRLRQSDDEPLARLIALSGALALLLVFAVLLRTAGAMLVAGVGAWFVLSFVTDRHHWKTRLLAFGIPLAAATASQLAWSAYGHWVREQALLGWPAAYGDLIRMLDPHQPELGYATLAEILARIPGNLIQHGAHLFQLASGLSWVAQLWYSPFVLVPLVLVASGFVLSALRRISMVECYFALYMALYCVWPFDVGARFMLPVFPVAFLYAWRAVVELARLAQAQPARVALAACVLCFAVGAGSLLAGGSRIGLQAKLSPWLWLAAGLASAVLWYGVRRHGVALAGRAISVLARPLPANPHAPSIALWGGSLLLATLVAANVASQGSAGKRAFQREPLDIVQRASVEAAGWVKENVRASDVVMAQQLPVVHYVSGRRVVIFPATGDPHRIMAAIRESKTGFLIVSGSETGHNMKPPEEERLKALSSTYGKHLKLARTGRDFWVYEIVQDN